MAHKPVRYLTQFVYSGKRASRKKLLGSLHDFAEGTMAIGRLDENSEGLLLLTTDGMVSHKVRSKKVEKEYYVMVDGLITDEAVERMKTGVEIGVDGGKYMTLPCEARRLEVDPNFPASERRIRDDRHGPSSWASITITEGKNRQVRKMTAAVGFPTLRLIRVRIANICLNDLPAGEVLELESIEV